VKWHPVSGLLIAVGFACGVGALVAGAYPGELDSEVQVAGLGVALLAVAILVSGWKGR